MSLCFLYFCVPNFDRLYVFLEYFPYCLRLPYSLSIKSSDPFPQGAGVVQTISGLESRASWFSWEFLSGPHPIPQEAVAV